MTIGLFTGPDHKKLHDNSVAISQPYQAHIKIQQGNIMEPIRLNKFLAQAGVCSRRKADELIALGKVNVNGQVVVELGCKITPNSDTVKVDGEIIALPNATEKDVYLVLNKPIQVVCTVSDPEGRPTILDCLPEAFKDTRLYPVGRLDYFSEGLLILTNDGTLTHRLTHPRYYLEKIYEVRVRETPTPEDIARMEKGMHLKEGEQLAPVKVRFDSDSNTLFLTLHQGVNRQIRRMCRDLGLTILKLKRLQTGPLTLGNLPTGECRELTDHEITTLQNAVGIF